MPSTINQKKKIAAALIAAGFMSTTPALASEPPGQPAALVAVQGFSGITHGAEFVKGDKLEIQTDTDAVIGLQVLVDPEFNWPASLVSPEGSSPLAVDIHLTGEDAVGIALEQQSILAWERSGVVHAATALKGSGEIWLGYYFPDQHGQYDVAGAIDMKEGAITSDADNHFQYVGLGELGTYRAGGGTLTVGKTATTQGETFLRIGTLQMAAGTAVTVAGDAPDDTNVVPDNRVLIVKNLESTGDDAGLRGISVTGEGTLVVGTPLSEEEDFTQMRKDILRVINTSKVVTGSLSKATLITGPAFQAGSAFSIVVGEKFADAASVETSGIHIGSDGRWIVHFEDGESASGETGVLSLQELAGADAATTIAAEDGAELILYNWDGSAFYVGDFNAENVHSFGGVRIQVDANGVASRLWCKDFAGLKGSELVGFVEAAEDSSLYEALPGYRFILDTFDEEAVGRDVYANVIDGALFLPASSGIAAAAERALQDAVQTVMTHDLSLFEGKGHWWVDGRTSETDASEIFSGGSGSFGFEADTTLGTLGYDFAFARNWIGTFAVSFAGIDTESKGQIARTTGSMSLAAFSLAAARRFDDFTLRLLLAFSRASGDAEQRVAMHRLETDTDIDFVTAAARVTAHAAGDLLLEPYAQIAFNTARLHDGSIMDYSTEGGVSGEGFKTSAGNRYWGTLEAGADAAMVFRLSESHTVKPSLGVSLQTAAGDTDWEIETRLFDGNGASSASFESARKFAARLRAAVEIAGSGFQEAGSGLFGASTPGRIEPYAWKLLLAGEYEAASDSESQSAFSVQFRQLF